MNTQIGDIVALLQADPLGNVWLGAFFTVAGILLIVFHKAIRRSTEDWDELVRAARLSWFFDSEDEPRGTFLTIVIIVSGTALILAGIAELVRALF
jgi:uncharacterized membrane protein HdeD (DUF308 family)